MNIKESFRYQNFLDGLIDCATFVLRDTRQHYKVTQHHSRSAVYEGGVDEVVEVVDPVLVKRDINAVANFIKEVLDEKQKISHAVAEVKANAGFDIDGELGLNKTRRTLSNCLAMISRAKGSEKIVKGTDYKFNAEGNQISYVYNILEESELLFNPQELKSMSKQLLDEADEISSKVDKFLITTELDVEPKFDVNSSFEDIFDLEVTLLS